MANSIKSELGNAAKLFRLKLRDSRKGIVAVLVAVAVLMFMNGIVAWQGFVNTARPLVGQNFMDFSALLLILAPIAIAYIFWQEATGKNSVYPQTAISRFLSTQMLSFFLVLLALCVVLLLHFLTLALFSLVGIWNSSLIMGYSFSLGFLASGFFAALIFLVMVTTAFSLIADLVRVFKLYAVVALIALAAFTQLYPILYASRVLPFLDALNLMSLQFERLFQLFLEPQTYLAFVAACLVASVTFFVAGLCLRWLVSRDYDTAQTSWMLALTYLSCIVVILTLGFSLYVGQGQHLTPGSVSDVFPAEAQVFEIRPQHMHMPEDSPMFVMAETFHRSRDHIIMNSELPDDHELDQMQQEELNEVYLMDEFDMANIFVEGNGLFVTANTFEMWDFRALHEAGYFPLEPFRGENITVNYIPASFDKTSPRLQEVANPMLWADSPVWAFEGDPLRQDTLNIRHTYAGEGNVLFIPIWSMMGLIAENAENSRPRIEIHAVQD